MGFLIAPVFIYDGWKNDYNKLLDKVKNDFEGEKITFEVITHRFTERAKNNILTIYKDSTLPMKEDRKFKYG
ncbi:spore photoproduct lyase family protein [Clostridium gallinarum]|uniref:spore photoproduct lyase family protein n=1 Tax=Clostridium gallinarum TaxID=2762246 RepID=UPI003C2DBF7B